MSLSLWCIDKFFLNCVSRCGVLGWLLAHNNLTFGGVDGAAYGEQQNQSSNANMCQPIYESWPCSPSPTTKYLGIAPLFCWGTPAQLEVHNVHCKHCQAARPLLEDFLASCDYVGALGSFFFFGLMIRSVCTPSHRPSWNDVFRVGHRSTVT